MEIIKILPQIGSKSFNLSLNSVLRHKYKLKAKHKCRCFSPVGLGDLFGSHFDVSLAAEGDQCDLVTDTDPCVYEPVEGVPHPWPPPFHLPWHVENEDVPASRRGPQTQPELGLDKLVADSLAPPWELVQDDFVSWESGAKQGLLCGRVEIIGGEVGAEGTSDSKRMWFVALGSRSLWKRENPIIVKTRIIAATWNEH